MGRELTCPDCNSYTGESLGNHIGQSDCELPDFSQRQKEIITGLLLSDGYINASYSDNQENPRLEVEQNERAFLEWLLEEFPYHTSGDIKSKDRGQYLWQSRTSTQMQSVFDEWYSNGERRVPSRIDLTPLSLAVWYAGDGTLKRDTTPRISAQTEIVDNGREEFIRELFNEMPFEITIQSQHINVAPSEADAFFEYIDGPIPGHTGKWI